MSHAVAVAVYAVLGTTGVVLEVLSRSSESIPSLHDVLGWVMRTRVGRVGVLTGWMWLGLHFFAR